MLPCVCSVIDHRGRQNVVTATWNLFVLFNKKHTTSAFYFKIFLNYSKAGLCPLRQTRKKAISCNLLSIQNEAISLVAVHNKEL